MRGITNIEEATSHAPNAVDQIHFCLAWKDYLDPWLGVKVGEINGSGITSPLVVEESAMDRKE